MLTLAFHNTHHTISVIQPRKFLGMERFEDLKHELLPPRLPAWVDALKSVDVSAPPEKRQGLWLPEAEMVVSPQNPVRRVMHLANWLFVRLPLLNLLSGRRRYQPIGSDGWRNFLGRLPRLSADDIKTAQASGGKRKKKNQAQADKRNKHKDEVFQWFSKIVSRGNNVVVIEPHPDVPQALHWRGQVIPLQKSDNGE